jgi:hypothetical protein
MTRSSHSHLAAQVAALRKLVEARLGNSAGPVYLRDGDPIPDGVDPDRVVFIARQFIDPPERIEDELPAPQEPSRDEGNGGQRQERRYGVA